MKTKIFFRIIAVALIAIMCLGVVACDKSNKKDKETTGAETTGAETTVGTTEAITTGAPETTGITDNSGNSSIGGGTANAGDEEALYAEFLAAYEASMAYDGSITVDAIQTQSEQEGEEKSEAIMRSHVSLDPANKTYFEKSTMTRDTYSHDTIVKMFTVDGVMYEYDNVKRSSGESEPSVEETYTKNADTSILEYMGEFMEYTLGGAVGGAYKAKTYSELKAAFAKVFSEIKDREIIEYKEDGALKPDATITVEPEISIKKENGETVLTIVAHFEADELADDSHTILNNYVVAYTRTVSVKDGKISAVAVDYSLNADVTETSDDGTSETLKVAGGMARDYDIEYVFDQAGYDSITVSLPNEEEIVDASGEDGIVLNIHLGAIETGVVYYEERYETASEIFEIYASSVKNIGYTYENIDGQDVRVDFVTANGFYRDEALTQAIDLETLTSEDLKTMGDVYVGYTIKEGMALVNEISGRVDELSLEYQIVSSDLFSSESSGKNVPRAISVSNPFTIRDEESKYEYKVLVNGVETEGYTITLENGKVYIIETLRIVKDADKDMDFIIPDMF